MAHNLSEVHVRVVRGRAATCPSTSTEQATCQSQAELLLQQTPIKHHHDACHKLALLAALLVSMLCIAEA